MNSDSKDNSDKAYEKAAIISKISIDAIMERLRFMKETPNRILCLGRDAKRLQEQCAKHFPSATLLMNEIDLMEPVDWIIAHFTLPYQNEPISLPANWHASLRENGLLFVTHFGRDTLQEWRAHQETCHLVRPFCVDMHDLGDQLLSLGWENPVLDVEYYHTKHRDTSYYQQELLASDMTLANTSIVPPPDEEGAWLTTYEVIFAHAFKGTPRLQEEAHEGMHEVSVPISQVKRHKS